MESVVRRPLLTISNENSSELKENLGDMFTLHYTHINIFSIFKYPTTQQYTMVVRLQRVSEIALLEVRV